MKKTIMTVDDSASVRMMVSFTLSELGFDIVEAANGRDALKKLRNQSMDLMITDVNMPELDGIGLVKAVRDMPEHRFTPIIILTTEAGDEKRRAGKQAGATGWVVKPFVPEQLVTAVRRVLE